MDSTIRRSAVVTGASTGIGRATALRLARENWRVFAGVRRNEDGEQLSADSKHYRGKLTPISLDVTNEAQVTDALSAITAELGSEGLSLIVNNAGVALGGPIEYLDMQTWRDQFDVNVFGQIAVTKAALPLLRIGNDGHGKHGRIIFIGSNSGRVATPMLGPYAASKFAIEGLADALRMELNGTEISVVVIEPGAVATPIWEKGRSLADKLDAELSDEAKSRYATLISGVRHGIEMQETSGVPPEKAADVVMRAVNAKRPLTRYQVGLDGKISVLAARFLPDRVKDFATQKLMKV